MGPAIPVPARARGRRDSRQGRPAEMKAGRIYASPACPGNRDHGRWRRCRRRGQARSSPDPLEPEISKLNKVRRPLANPPGKADGAAQGSTSPAGATPRLRPSPACRRPLAPGEAGEGPAKSRSSVSLDPDSAMTTITTTHNNNNGRSRLRSPGAPEQPLPGRSSPHRLNVCSLLRARPAAGNGAGRDSQPRGPSPKVPAAHHVNECLARQNHRGRTAPRRRTAARASTCIIKGPPILRLWRRSVGVAPAWGVVISAPVQRGDRRWKSNGCTARVPGWRSAEDRLAEFSVRPVCVTIDCCSGGQYSRRLRDPVAPLRRAVKLTRRRRPKTEAVTKPHSVPAGPEAQVDSEPRRACRLI